MTSDQTLSDAERRILAGWAADCAGRVVQLFEADPPADEQIRDALDRARAYGDGGGTAAEEIRKRMIAVKAASAATTPAGAAAARSVGQAAAVAHMGAHALGAAAYAVKAVSLANPQRPDAVDDEVSWQVAHLSDDARAVLQLLPVIGEGSGGPLGPGLLSRGVLGSVIRDIQTRIRVD
ncbi:hypothetical protein QSJ19_18920 [Gordonia sp. ABSL11-1]|uniref:putative immunity protein n=1 Tax=Gordonia sp. ABSL11-1 TaxID=3053924 RepID=UPI002572B4F6|nr:hypothetical protein [Gordonia sp. ABSL11-1]MDL9947616.1 hypothetical protein [Gordonia sp. ABSL11-1]